MLRERRQLAWRGRLGAAAGTWTPLSQRATPSPSCKGPMAATTCGERCRTTHPKRSAGRCDTSRSPSTSTGEEAGLLSMQRLQSHQVGMLLLRQLTGVVGSTRGGRGGRSGEALPVSLACATRRAQANRQEVHPGAQGSTAAHRQQEHSAATPIGAPARAGHAAPQPAVWRHHPQGERPGACAPSPPRWRPTSSSVTKQHIRAQRDVAPTNQRCDAPSIGVRPSTGAVV